MSRRRGPAWLYRAYDSTDRLIYIGVTVDLFGRLHSHRNSWWAPTVARVRATVHPTITDARELERLAIANENPRWNVAGRWPARRGWTADDYRDYAIALTARGPLSSYNERHLARVQRECFMTHGVDPYPLHREGGAFRIGKAGVA